MKLLRWLVTAPFKAFGSTLLILAVIAAVLWFGGAILLKAHEFVHQHNPNLGKQSALDRLQ